MLTTPCMKHLCSLFSPKTKLCLELPNSLTRLRLQQIITIKRIRDLINWTFRVIKRINNTYFVLSNFIFCGSYLSTYGQIIVRVNFSITSIDPVIIIILFLLLLPRFPKGQFPMSGHRKKQYQPICGKFEILLKIRIDCRIFDCFVDDWRFLNSMVSK